jgi:transposase InsO family protein
MARVLSLNQIAVPDDFPADEFEAVHRKLAATTGGIAGEDVRDLMVAAVEYRFGQVSRLPVTIEWLSDNGSCYVAGDTRSFARDIGLEPRTTPLESPQSNGMAEAFVIGFLHLTSPDRGPSGRFPTGAQRHWLCGGRECSDRVPLGG